MTSSVLVSTGYSHVPPTHPRRRLQVTARNELAARKRSTLLPNDGCHAALLKLFDRAGKVKNICALLEADRAARFNLVSPMVSLVFDAGTDYGELCRRPETQQIWDEYASTPGASRPAARTRCAPLPGGNSGAPTWRTGRRWSSRRSRSCCGTLPRSGTRCTRRTRSVDYAQGRPDPSGPNDNWTPLLIAAQNNHLDVAELLLANGANHNQQNNDRRSPLNPAAFQGHLDVVDLLVDRGTDLNTKGKFESGGPRSARPSLTARGRKSPSTSAAKGAESERAVRNRTVPVAASMSCTVYPALACRLLQHTIIVKYNSRQDR